MISPDDPLASLNRLLGGLRTAPGDLPSSAMAKEDLQFLAEADALFQSAQKGLVEFLESIGPTLNREQELELAQVILALSAAAYRLGLKKGRSKSAVKAQHVETGRRANKGKVEKKNERHEKQKQVLRKFMKGRAISTDGANDFVKRQIEAIEKAGQNFKLDGKPAPVAMQKHTTLVMLVKQILVEPIVQE